MIPRSWTRSPARCVSAAWARSALSSPAQREARSGGEEPRAARRRGRCDRGRPRNARPANVHCLRRKASDAEFARARALVDRLWHSDDPADIARLQAQARLIAAYEESRWPRRSASTAGLIRHLMDQHGLTRADMVPILGTPSQVSEVLRGTKGLSMTMVQRLRARFRAPADLLIPAPKRARRNEKGRGLIP
jgi:HTH-type transcriptional regulator/antitoxin HigA